MCPTYSYACPRCSTEFDEYHSMRNIPESAECPECHTKAPRQFTAPAFSTRGDDLDGGRPVYCPGLARKMPYNRDDPQAMFTSKTKAREAARRKADTGDYQLHFD